MRKEGVGSKLKRSSSHTDALPRSAGASHPGVRRAAHRPPSAHAAMAAPFPPPPWDTLNRDPSALPTVHDLPLAQVRFPFPQRAPRARARLLASLAKPGKRLLPSYPRRHSRLLTCMRSSFSLCLLQYASLSICLLSPLRNFALFLFIPSSFRLDFFLGFVLFLRRPRLAFAAPLPVEYCPRRFAYIPFFLGVLFACRRYGFVFFNDGISLPCAKLIQSAAALAMLLDENKDEQILKEACLGLCQLFGEGIQNDRIQAILEADVVPRLVALLKPNRSRNVPVSVQAAALQVIGNVACGDDRQTQVIIDCDALPCLRVGFY